MGKVSPHWIPSNRARQTPELWRDGLVQAVDVHVVVVDFVDGTSARYFNHHDLREWLQPGTPVSVHSRYPLLAGPRWLSVKKIG